MFQQLIVFILAAKIGSKKVCKKNGKLLSVGKDLTSVQQEHRALAISRTNFYFERKFLEKDEEEKFDNSEKFTEKFAIFRFVCLLSTFKLPNTN